MRQQKTTFVNLVTFFTEKRLPLHSLKAFLMDIAYSQPVVEFVTVGAEYCAFLEQSQGRDKTALADTLLKLLPLLYVKAQLLPHVEGGASFGTETYVTEQDYNWLRAILADVLGDEDEYEDVVRGDAMETDDIRWMRISEGLADIYQPVRDFVECFRNGVAENIEDALWALNDSFELYWGGNLVDVLRRLHRLKYGTPQV